jgi:hypothetical protein
MQQEWSSAASTPLRGVMPSISSPPVRIGQPRVWLGMLGTVGAAAVVITGLYARSFRGPIHLLPSDPFSYAWQFRAAREGLLGSVDPRPGTAVLGAMLEGFGVVPDSLAPTLLAFALLAVIGLAVAAITRRALGLPSWAWFPIAVAAATFGGTAKLMGYVANLVALACFLAGVGAVLASHSRPWRGSLVAAASFLAAGLAHPGILPAWFAILGGWLALAVLSWLFVRWRRRGETPHPFDRRPVIAFVAMVVGALGALAIVLGALGRSTSELGNLSTARPYFAQRLADTWEWILPTVGLSVLGLVLAVMRGRRSGDRSGQALLLGWIGVCLGGVGLMLVFPGFPGHRTLMLAIPLGAAAGLVAVEIVLAATRSLGQKLWPAIVGGAVVVALLLVAAIGVLGIRGFGGGASAPWRERAVPSRRVAAYAGAHPGDVPLVMVFEPKAAEGARHWRVRLNIARSFLDGRRAAQLFIYVGDPKRLLSGRPSVFPGTADPLEEALNRISARTWPDVKDAMDDDADVLIPRGYVQPRSWKHLLANGAERSGVVDLAVVGGAPLPPTPIPSYASSSLVDGWMAAVISVILFGLIGSGVGVIVSSHDADPPSDALVMAPAFGVVVMVLVGTGVALAGGAPGGPSSVAASVGVGVGCWLVLARGLFRKP